MTQRADRELVAKRLAEIHGPEEDYLRLADAILPLLEDGCGCWHCGEETDPNCACQRRLQAREGFLGEEK